MTLLELTNPCLLGCVLLFTLPLALAVLYPLVTWRSRSVESRSLAVLFGILLLSVASLYVYEVAIRDPEKDNYPRIRQELL